MVLQFMIVSKLQMPLINSFTQPLSPSEFDLPSMSDLPTPCSQLSAVEITRTDVYTALCALDETKAYGLNY